MNLFGAACVQCGKTLAIASHGLCSKCNKNISRFTYCGCCGSPVSVYAQHCGNCLRDEPAWDQMVIVGRYSEPLSVLIHRFKFQRQFWLDKTLARLLLLAIYEARRSHRLAFPEVILPVPLHHFRQWRRGYNQADLLATQLANYLALPKNNALLKRTKHTPTQRGLSAKERRNNLRGAFVVDERIAQYGYRSVALVDDVITTGSTLNEIAKKLRQSGIRHIQVWGLARA
ncbi:amidophosphoribosyltransferase [Caviibacterium pharyngocola]|uniref:Amidophosphoribosyltransferase n=1 Tax=Caviibacterium pharyngocola TaxID=28159 RepID=A0A2M8RWJ9_9PAST|nr:amidophosphoribosyltransferase [Caviibacterium pharyngocola]PJG83253.1 amidophosphoribosyltransferase [Caviibacterium pharyngocola]